MKWSLKSLQTWNLLDMKWLLLIFCQKSNRPHSVARWKVSFAQLEWHRLPISWKNQNIALIAFQMLVTSICLTWVTPPCWKLPDKLLQEIFFCPQHRCSANHRHSASCEDVDCLGQTSEETQGKVLKCPHPHINNVSHHDNLNQPINDKTMLCPYTLAYRH